VKIIIKNLSSADYYKEKWRAKVMNHALINNKIQSQKPAFMILFTIADF
jgi:hypothetical protein